MLTPLTLDGRAQALGALVRQARCTDATGQAWPLDQGMDRLSEQLRDTRRAGANVYLIGNGGSAAVASHIANDFCNIAALRAVALLDPAALTCFANDYGYPEVFAGRLRRMARPGDVLVAISSSGASANIVNAAAEMARQGGTTVTFSGFRPDNALRALGAINFWVDSDDYGLVEVGHLFMLHHLVQHIRITWASADD